MPCSAGTTEIQLSLVYAGVGALKFSAALYEAIFAARGVDKDIEIRDET
jgi:hypothetical protein